MEAEFSNLEAKFLKLDALAHLTLEKKCREFTHLTDRITNSSDYLKIFIELRLNEKRQFLLDNLWADLSTKIAELDAHSKLVYHKNPKDFIEFSDKTHLIGDLKYENGFPIAKKFKYLNLVNQFDELKISDDLVDYLNAKILVLNKNKLFLYLKTKQEQNLLKIVNKKCEQLAIRKLEGKLAVRNIMAWGLRVVCLMHNESTKKNELYVFDEDLSLTSSEKNLGNDVSLCSLGDEEMFFWHESEKKCRVLDYSLRLVGEYGQDLDENRPFYFANGIVIDASDKRMLFYYYDPKQYKHCVKVIGRESGLLSGVINLEFDYFSKMIRLDSESNILMKLFEPNNLIRYFNADGSVLDEFRNEEFFKFSRIDLTRDDEIVCFDQSHSSIFFL